MERKVKKNWHNLLSLKRINRIGKAWSHCFTLKSL